MDQMRIAHVFVNETREFGNPLGIIVDEKNLIDRNSRQHITLESGFSEVVFINNIQKRDISIFSPYREIPFAGHAVVGTVFYLTTEYQLLVTSLISMGKTIEAWVDGNLTWVRGELAITPPWNFEEIENAHKVDQISAKDKAFKKHTMVWSWIDKDKNLVRARTFAPDWGISEDEANGSGSMQLAIKLNTDLVVNHGKGSIIYARPSSKKGYADLGGMVKINLI